MDPMLTWYRNFQYFWINLPTFTLWCGVEAQMVLRPHFGPPDLRSKDSRSSANSKKPVKAQHSTADVPQSSCCFLSDDGGSSGPVSLPPDQYVPFLLPAHLRFGSV